MEIQKNKEQKEITRKEALKKIGNYGKYTALTALGTFIVLNSQKAQCQSLESPGTGFWELFKKDKEIKKIDFWFLKSLQMKEIVNL